VDQDLEEKSKIHLPDLGGLKTPGGRKKTVTSGGRKGERRENI